ncbi:MFS transporter [Cytobacillus sp. Hm23]
MKTNLFSPLKNKQFRALFSAQVVSDLGTLFDLTALFALFAYHWELGPYYLALLSIAFGLPWVLFGPVAGVFADRLPQKLVMITSDLIRALVVFCLVFAPNAYVVIILVAIKGFFNALFDPARQSAIKQIVPDDMLLQANALSQLSLNLSRVIGPSLGAIVLAVSTPQTAFVLDSITFLLSAIFLLKLPKMRHSRVEEKVHEKQTVNSIQILINELKEGLQYVVTNKLLIFLISFNGAVFFIIFLFDSIGVLLAKSFGFSESIYAIFSSVIGLGSIIGSIIISRLGKKINEKVLMCSSAVLLGVLITLNGVGGIGYIPPSLLFWLLIWLMIGICVAVITICYGYLLQKTTPQHVMGRVSSIGNAIINAFIVISPALGALIASMIGVGGVFLIAGIAMILLGGIVSFSLRGQQTTSISASRTKAHS